MENRFFNYFGAWSREGPGRPLGFGTGLGGTVLWTLK